MTAERWIAPEAGLLVNPRNGVTGRRDAHLYPVEMRVKKLEELNAEKLERARGVFTSVQIHNWEGQARRDAEANVYQPPTMPDLLLGEHVYLMAWTAKRYKLARAKRDIPLPQPKPEGEK